MSNIELDDDVKPTSAHNALSVIEVNGVEIGILRANTPFGSVAAGEFGTYFIGYARYSWVTEQMLPEYVRRSPAGQLRPNPRFQHRGDRDAVFCPLAGCSGKPSRRSWSGARARSCRRRRRGDTQ